MSIISRSVSLYCPVCGNDQFSYVDTELDDLSEAPDETRLQCADCKSVFTKAELIAENKDVIDANVKEITEEAIKDLEKKLRKVFG